MWEFIHTSVRAGLQPNSSGFCPVAWTNGLPPHLVPLLEQMSAYRFLYPAAEDPEGRRSPVEFACRLVRYGAREWRIIGRIAGTRLDYSGRLNRIAHLLIVPDEEMPDASSGAVAICADKRNFMTEYDAPPQLLPLRTPGISDDPVPEKGVWERFHLDPGWAAAAARHFECGNGEPFYCLFAPGTRVEELLGIIASVMAELPPEERRRFTFSTYFSQNVPGCECYFRCIVPTAGRRGIPGTGVSLIDPSPVPPELRPVPKTADVVTEPSVISPSFEEEFSEPSIEESIDPVENQQDDEITELSVTSPSFTKNKPENDDSAETLPPPHPWRSRRLLAGLLTVLVLLAILGISLFYACRHGRKPPKPAPAVSTVRPETVPSPSAAQKTVPAKKNPAKPAPPKRSVPPPAKQTVSPAPVQTPPPPQQPFLPEKKKTVTEFRFQADLPVEEGCVANWSFRCIPAAPPALQWEDCDADASLYVSCCCNFRELKKGVAAAEKEKKKREAELKSAEDKESARRKAGKTTAIDLSKYEEALEDAQENLDRLKKKLRESRTKLEKEAQKLTRKITYFPLQEGFAPLLRIVKERTLPDADTARQCEAALHQAALTLLEDRKNEN